MVPLADFERLLEINPLLLATTTPADYAQAEDAAGACDRYRTPTSDRDFFAIASRDAGAIIRGALGHVERLDLELRDLAWFDAIELQLHDHVVSVGGGLSPFGYLDLRFLSRIGGADLMIDTGNLGARLDCLHDLIRIASSELLSTRFVSLFEDAVGFALARRADDVRLIAGELVQYACLLALLQVGRVDLAPKWAPARCVAGAHSGLRSATIQARAHLSAVPAQGAERWAIDLLHQLNTIIANGICAARGWQRVALDASVDATAIPWCLMGIAAQPSLADVERNRILMASDDLVRAVAGGAPANGVATFRLAALG